MRCQQGDLRIVSIAPCLSETQKLAAKVLAAAFAADGADYVMVLMTDVLAVLHDVAA